MTAAIGIFRCNRKFLLHRKQFCLQRRGTAAGWLGNDTRLWLRSSGGVPVEPFSQGVTVTGAVQASDMASPETFSPPGDLAEPPQVWPEKPVQREGRTIDWIGVHSRFFATVVYGPKMRA